MLSSIGSRSRVPYRLWIALGAGALLALLTWAAPAWAENNQTSTPPTSLDLGVFPYLSTRALLDLYEPVRAHLQAALKLPTNLYTASNFKTYADRTKAGGYDVLATPPHLARLAQREAGYIPLAIFTRELRCVIVVAKDSPLQTLSDLKGGSIATPSKLALVTITGSQFLRDNGLADEAGMLLRDVGSHSNAVLAVQRGEVDAAMTESVALQQMPESVRKSVRVIAQTERLPHVMFLAHPRLGQARADKISGLLLHLQDTAEGRSFFKSSGFEGLRRVEEADLKSVDPVLKELKRLLDAMPP